MPTSGRLQSLRDKLRSKKSLLDFLWWLLITVGAGLLQVWVLLLVMLLLMAWPETRGRLGIADWGLSRILGNSVLIFFATSLLGQAVYAMSEIRGPRPYHRRFAAFFLGANFVAAILLYVFTVLFGEPSIQTKYGFDIFFTLQALGYAAWVEFRIRRRFRLKPVQELPVRLT